MRAVCFDMFYLPRAPNNNDTENTEKEQLGACIAFSSIWG